MNGDHKFYVVSGAVFSEDDTNGVRFGPRSVAMTLQTRSCWTSSDVHRFLCHVFHSASVMSSPIDSCCTYTSEVFSTKLTDSRHTPSVVLVSPLNYDAWHSVDLHGVLVASSLWDSFHFAACVLSCSLSIAFQSNDVWAYVVHVWTAVLFRVSLLVYSYIVNLFVEVCM